MIRGLGVNPHPFQSEHLPVGDTSDPVAFYVTSRTSSNTQRTQTVSTGRDLGLLLNTGFSADNTAARATKKSPWNAFLPIAILRDPDPKYFLPMYKAFI